MISVRFVTWLKTNERCLSFTILPIPRGTLGFVVLLIAQFFLRYFGKFSLEMRYCGMFRTCGMQLFSIFDGIKNHPSSTLVLQRFPSLF